MQQYDLSTLRLLQGCQCSIETVNENVFLCLVLNLVLNYALFLQGTVHFCGTMFGLHPKDLLKSIIYNKKNL